MPEASYYRWYDKEALDQQYNNRVRFPHYKAEFEKWRARSAATRSKLHCHLDVAYGNEPSEQLDVFPAASPNAPIYAFLHGGYWHSLDKSDYSFVAEGMLPHGVLTVVPNFALAPRYGMDEIVRQNRALIAWLFQHAREYGGDPQRIYAGGHSAGGHLVTMLLATDWPRLFGGLPKNAVKGGCAISAIFELEPIRLCYLNNTLGMSKEVADRNSPLLQHYPAAAPLMIVLGEGESEEYYRQSYAMASLWGRLGYPLEVRLEPARDHFNVVDDLIDPKSDLVRAQLRHLT